MYSRDILSKDDTHVSILNIMKVATTIFFIIMKNVGTCNGYTHVGFARVRRRAREQRVRLAAPEQRGQLFQQGLQLCAMLTFATCCCCARRSACCCCRPRGLAGVAARNPCPAAARAHDWHIDA